MKTCLLALVVAVISSAAGAGTAHLWRVALTADLEDARADLEVLKAARAVDTERWRQVQGDLADIKAALGRCVVEVPASPAGGR